MVGGSPGTPASSTTKTGRHDIAEILLKVELNTKNQSIILNFYHNNPWHCINVGIDFGYYSSTNFQTSETEKKKILCN